MARDFVDVCELLIADPAILDVGDSATPSVRMTTTPLVIDNQFHARAVLSGAGRRGRLRGRGTFVLEVDAVDRGPQPRTELRLCSVAQRPSLRSLLSGGRSRRVSDLVQAWVQQFARRIDRALTASQRPELSWRHPVEQWIEELLRTEDQQHNP